MLRTAKETVLGSTEPGLGPERTAAPEGPAVWHWSTAAIPPQERVSRWHDVHARAIARRTIAVDVAEMGEVDVHLWRLGPPGRQVAVQRMHISDPSVATRRATLLHDGNDDVVLHLQLAGPRRVIQRGRESDTAPGGGVFSWNAEPSTIVLPEPATFFSIALPHRALAAMAPRIGDAVARALPGGAAALSLLHRYLALADLDAGGRDPLLGAVMGRHVLDLAALLASSLDGRAVEALGPAGAGVRAARLLAFKADLVAHLDEPVSAAWLASRHGVSPRYVHQLFASEGVSVSHHVQGLRLERVWQALADPRQARASIAAMAMTAGFGDLSTFNHAFRARFGMTPREARAQAAAHRVPP